MVDKRQKVVQLPPPKNGRKQRQPDDKKAIAVVQESVPKHELLKLPIRERMAEIEKMAYSGMTEELVAYACDSNDPDRLFRYHPEVEAAYKKGRIKRAREVGEALLASACAGNYKAQEKVLEEFNWQRRKGLLKGKDALRRQVIEDNFDPAQVLKDIIVSQMIAVNDLGSEQHEQRSMMLENIRRATADLNALRGDDVHTKELDMTAARASSEYARLRMTFMHLPDDELPEHVKRALDGLQKQIDTDKGNKK